MDIDPIHENLNTTFVDLGSLVKHLYGLQFVGRVHIELSSYEADIVFRSKNLVHAREYDHLTGRLRDGEKALRSILLKAKEPNGRINVYREIEQIGRKPIPAKIFVDEAIVSGARRMAYGFCDTNASSVFAEQDILDLGCIDRDRYEFKQLILELLKNATAAFTKQGLDFEVLFRNACIIMADRFSFTLPDAGELQFKEERLYVAEHITAAKLANAISAILGHVLFQLRTSSEHRDLFDHTTNRMRAVLARRNSLLDRLVLRRQFEKLVDY